MSAPQTAIRAARQRAPGVAAVAAFLALCAACTSHDGAAQSPTEHQQQGPARVTSRQTAPADCRVTRHVQAPYLREDVTLRCGSRVWSGHRVAGRTAFEVDEAKAGGWTLRDIRTGPVVGGAVAVVLTLAGPSGRSCDVDGTYTSHSGSTVPARSRDCRQFDTPRQTDPHTRAA